MHKFFGLVLAVTLVACGSVGSVSVPDSDPDAGIAHQAAYSELGATIAEECNNVPGCALPCYDRPGIKLYCEKTCADSCQPEVDGICYQSCLKRTDSLESIVLDERCFQECSAVEEEQCKSVCVEQCYDPDAWTSNCGSWFQ